ncbi:unnamed protein product [Cylindrotheca closterium]|uniref:Uncharacterized protein n=1 Tax=Cylindrotheca closterium TaxID=2856 RepID=A0AAD2CP20_9STRA|nr:unnamed protein product [Cylindrotheca closterium]
MVRNSPNNSNEEDNVPHQGPRPVSHGRKEYRKALNQKRQTLSNTLKNLVIEMFMDPGSVDPPRPQELYSQDRVTGKITGLRQNRVIYIKFLRNFGKAIYGKAFKEECVVKTLSSFFPECLEAFMVLAYDNGYKVWKSIAEKKMEGKGGPTASAGASEEASTTSSVGEQEDNDTTFIGFKYTSNSRGSKRSEGWSQAGCDLYDQLWDTLEEQRRNPTLGEEFETAFLISGDEVIQTTRRARNRPLRNNWSDLAGSHGNTTPIVQERGEVVTPQAMQQVQI